MAGTAAVTTLVLLAGHPQIVYQLVFVAIFWAAALTFRHRSWRRLADLGDRGRGRRARRCAAAARSDRREARQLARLRADAGPSWSRRRSRRSRDRIVQILLGSFRHVERSRLRRRVRVDRPRRCRGGVRSPSSASASHCATRLRRPLAIALGAIAVIGVVWALGPRTPVFTFAYDWLPGFDLARGSARWLDVTAFAVALGVGMGDRRTRRSRPRRRRSGRCCRSSPARGCWRSRSGSARSGPATSRIAGRCMSWLAVAAMRGRRAARRPAGGRLGGAAAARRRCDRVRADGARPLLGDRRRRPRRPRSTTARRGSAPSCGIGRVSRSRSRTTSSPTSPTSSPGSARTRTRSPRSGRSTATTAGSRSPIGSWRSRPARGRSSTRPCRCATTCRSRGDRRTRRRSVCGGSSSIRPATSRLSSPAGGGPTSSAVASRCGRTRPGSATPSGSLADGIRGRARARSAIADRARRDT